MQRSVKRRRRSANAVDGVLAAPVFFIYDLIMILKSDELFLGQRDVIKIKK